jgi:hypothetical protein
MKSKKGSGIGKGGNPSKLIGGSPFGKTASVLGGKAKKVSG